MKEKSVIGKDIFKITIPPNLYIYLWVCMLLLLLSRFSRVQLCARWQPTRLLHPWDSPGKKTGVGCHFLLQCMKVKSENEVAQLCWLLVAPWSVAYQCSLRPWDFPGKSTGVGCHFLLQWACICLHKCKHICVYMHTYIYYIYVIYSQVEC